MIRDTGARPDEGSRCDSWPDGGGVPSPTTLMEWSKASRLVRPASVSSEPDPAGRKNASNLAIAPAVLAKSRA